MTSDDSTVTLDTALRRLKKDGVKAKKADLRPFMEDAGDDRISESGIEAFVQSISTNGNGVQSPEPAAEEPVVAPIPQPVSDPAPADDEPAVPSPRKTRRKAKGTDVVLTRGVDSLIAKPPPSPPALRKRNDSDKERIKLINQWIEAIRLMPRPFRPQHEEGVNSFGRPTVIFEHPLLGDKTSVRKDAFVAHVSSSENTDREAPVLVPEIIAIISRQLEGLWYVRTDCIHCGRRMRHNYEAKIKDLLAGKFVLPHPDGKHQKPRDGELWFYDAHIECRELWPRLENVELQLYALEGDEDELVEARRKLMKEVMLEVYGICKPRMSSIQKSDVLEAWIAIEAYKKRRAR